MSHSFCLVLAAACTVVGCTRSSYVEMGYTPSEYQALSSASAEYERDVPSSTVYSGLYENKAAIRHYCGDGAGVTDIPAWLAACERKLERVYWARVRTQYKYADWQEVTDYCDLQPDACDTPSGVDGAIRSSHISGAQRRNYQRAQEVEEQRAERIAAETAAYEKFVQTLTCSGISDLAARGECLGQRVIRCKSQLSAMGSGVEGYCVETSPGNQEAQ